VNWPGWGVEAAAPAGREILKKIGIDPAPRRTGPAWPLLPRSRAETILACDFFTAGLLDGTQAYVLAVTGARRQAHQDSRSHAASHRGLDRPAGRKLLMNPRRAAAPGQLHDRDRGPDFIATPDFVHVDTILLRRLYALIIIDTAPAASTWPTSPRTPTAYGQRRKPATCRLPNIRRRRPDGGLPGPDQSRPLPRCERRRRWQQARQTAVYDRLEYRRRGHQRAFQPTPTLFTMKVTNSDRPRGVANAR
jgi:hypothetical protein